jgi:crotonobetainyl-CoA:carnitine CoA-transferase CaiB-like acyl-CoA transferase
VGDTAAYFLAVNRNKRSIDLDLQSPGGREAAETLVAGSDVVVENWRPGTAAGSARRRNPDQAPSSAGALLHHRVRGRWRSARGYDQIVRAWRGG